MKAFNPEKELKKIQKRNKNKVILGVIALLLVITIGSSYALYQIKYNKKIIYTTVEPFYNKDMQLAVYVNGVRREEFPTKQEQLDYIGIDCEKDDITTANWNSVNWKLELTTKGPNKCTVFFAKSQSFSEIIQVDNKTILNDDPDKNLRYVGIDPNNYIWFNCNDYNLLSQETAKTKCEKWRIIGLFNNITKSDGTKENLVKIVRAKAIGFIPWNNASINNWTEASLQKSLNQEYLTENNDGSWIISEENIKSDPLYTPVISTNYKSITFNTLNMIEQVTWNIGGYNHTTWLAKDMYTDERGNIGVASNPTTTTWTGKIALPYASDVAYSIEENIRNKCLQSSLQWSDITLECATNLWVYDDSYHYTLTPAAPPSQTSVLTFKQTIGGSGDSAFYSHYISPSLYLKSSVKVLDGNGSSETPYILAP